MEIFSILEKVSDPRRDHLKKYSLESIFYITISAVLCGAESWNEVAEFGRAREDFFRERIKDFQGIPSHDTFNRLFSLLDPKELELGFRSWIQDICGKYKGIVNIDGKEICGAKEEKRNGSFDSLRMVSAWSSENGVSLGQERVDKKSNEIKAIPKLIESLDLQGCIVTIDAIGCQHEIVKEVAKAHADYLICVKSNQKTLYKTITSWFNEIDMEGNKVEGHGHIPSTRYQMAYKEEKRAHGREEKRFCQVYNNGCTAAVLGWENANSVVCLTKESTRIKTGKTTIEKRYFITSLPLDSEGILQAIRSHWGIENKLHWQLDITFNEDDQRKKGNAAQNFSLIAKIAMTQLKNNPRKGSMAMKRKMAGWNSDFLVELLDAEWNPPCNTIDSSKK